MAKTNNDFNSALALFQSLFKSHKGDIFTIIERFILAGVKSQHLSSVTIERINQLLKDEFNIDIPKSIITKCVNNQKTFKYQKGEYLLINEPEQEIEDLLNELNEIDNKNDNIITGLYQYIEHKQLVNLSDEDREEIRKVFFDYVKDRENEYNHKYFLDITRYIIDHESDKAFLDSLDAIKEGTIIYHGIQYSQMSDAQSWKEETTFFLDMEYLFSSFGLNGSFYKECFYDFYTLVKEINDGSPSKMGRPRIRLMFFQKTKENIDRFFNVAARIKNGEEYLYNNSDAMEQIINHCADNIEVIKYKNELFNHLTSLGIHEYTDEIDLKTHCNWIFETKELITKMDSEFIGEDKDDLEELLLFSDYINILRGGKKIKKLESCNYVFLSQSKLANRFGQFLRENFEEANFLLCKMGIFTEIMWFKLRKGIVNNSSIATFKVLFKAKSIVSGFLNESVLNTYKQIKESNEDINTLKGLYAEIRSKRHTPEMINSQNANEDIDFFITDDVLNKYKEEQTRLKYRAEKADKAETELVKTKQSNNALIEENSNLKKQIKASAYKLLCDCRQRAKSKFCFENFIYSNAKAIILTFSFLCLIFCIIIESTSDCLLSPTAIISALFTILGFSISLPKKLYEKIKRYRNKRYRKYIDHELSK